VGAAGFAGMSVELAAVRALAPFFGASVFVWTNVIGVVLAALSAGYWIGGIAAHRFAPERLLRAALLTAGGLTLLAPFLVPVFGTFLLPVDAGVRLEDAPPLLAGGSLAASLVLFAPPVLLVGAVSPVAVRLLVAKGEMVGRASGLVLAAGTTGSLCGVFATTYALVPVAGVRNTFLASAALLAIAASLVPGRPAPALAALLPLALALLPGSPARAAPAGEERLFAADTRYQFVEIVRREKTRYLRVNEGLDSYQSVYVEDSPWTGAYYDLLALAPLLAEPVPAGGPLRVLVLGLGGGTVSRLYHALFAGTRDLSIDGVELDEGLVEAAREHFGLEGASHPRLRVFDGWDGRAALAVLPGPYDVVVLDAYAEQIHIPPHLATKECFEAVRDRLAPGGVFTANVGGFGFDDPVVAAIGATTAATFGEAQAVRVRDSRNLVLFAARDRSLDFERAYRRADAEDLRRIASYAAVPSVRRRYEVTAGPVLRDASSRLDLLAVRSLWERALRP